MIKYFKHNITDSVYTDIKKVIDSGHLTSGRYVEELEEKFRDLSGDKYALAVNSATAGLHLANIVMDNDNSRTITTNYTYVATAQSIEYAKNDIVLIDINKNYNMSLKVLKKSDGFSDVIIPVHMAGKLNNIKKIKEIKPGYGIIEDCAHCIPLQLKDKGDIRIYSFYANKLLTTGEGGMITTDNEEYYKRMKKLRHHGRTTSGPNYDVDCLGYKYNMSDINAVIGLNQIDGITERLVKRQVIANKYRKAFKKMGLKMQKHDFLHSYHLFLLRFKVPGEMDYVRTGLKPYVETSRHYRPINSLEYYRDKEAYKTRAYDYSMRTISLPIYSKLKDSEINEIIDRICTLVKEYRDKYEKVDT